MLTHDTMNNIFAFLQAVCQEHHLNRAYFAQKIGKRRHFLVGYGDEKFLENNHFDITDTIVFFWQARSNSFDIQMIKTDLLVVAKQLEQELN